MNRKFALLLFSLGFSGFAYSQHFLFGIGMGSMIQMQSAAPNTASFIIINSFRYYFYQTDNSSLSVDLPATIGFSSTNTVGPDITLGILINAPLLLCYNHGAGYKRESDSRFGYFAGAGFGFHRNEYTYTDNNYDHVRVLMNGIGPAVQTGVRLAVGRNGQHNFEIRISYMKLMQGYNSNILGFGCLFNF